MAADVPGVPIRKERVQQALVPAVERALSGRVLLNRLKDKKQRYYYDSIIKQQR